MGGGTGGGAGGPCGLSIVDKPVGWTSHDVVAQARRVLSTRRVGHAGTLDPDATGVLVLGVGRATRLLRYLSPLPKSYRGEVVLGVETSTLDASGEVVAEHDMGQVTLGDVQEAARRMVGVLDQVPPMVSAVQVGGRRLHQLAREGIEIERAPRRVTVHRFEVLPYVPPPGPSREAGHRGEGTGVGVVEIEVDCSSGTYVRSLAADLGRALGGGAHLRRLRRTAVGPFTLARARAVQELEVLPPTEAVAHLAAVTVDDEVAVLVANGTRLIRSGAPVAFRGEGPWALLSATGDLLAVYEASGERVSPSVVLAGPARPSG